ncbi:MAG TPA: M48 family metalloprotease [Sedimentisphaerales bacterium]|nr:M48 family metalloprotease [Sedimentisphaerales bacterium]HQI28394.1 M48 family metalloprotease [Sedimentisphaerales bacterium]
MNGKRLSIILLALSFSIPSLFGGCEGLPEAGTAIGQAVGVIDDDEADSILRGSAAVQKTFQDLTPEHEYYIGRAVAAKVLQSYQPFDRPEANAYLNLLGQSLAAFSNRPETFGGYHFLLLDSEEINAFAAPGGLILVTRGMVQCCQNEDELAAVLAHEIGHVEKKHGLSAIKQARLTSAFTILAAEAGKQFGGEDLAQLTEAFEGSVGDIVMTLTTRGYSRQQERSADAAAVEILRRAGYPQTALVTMLERMGQRLGSTSTPGFARTHPSAQSRIESVSPTIMDAGTTSNAVRQQRFAKAMQSVVAAK